jgi:sulfite reductase (NADPH) flavoprotein alpha-component
MLKTILFQLHWLLGISAGLVLSVMGLSGATLAFGDEIVRWANPPVAEAARRYAAGEAVLPVAELTRRLGVQADSGAARLLVDPTGTRPSLLRLAAERRSEIYFDPYSGQVLPTPTGVGFLHVVEDLHRRLAAGDRGKAVTGVCVLILLFFCLSGLYLRWPRQWWSWRAWWVVEWRRQGRSFLWSLHSVVGTWCLLLYLLIALTGLYWSYDWYRQGLVKLLGGPQTMQAGGRAGKPVAVEFARLQSALDTLPDNSRSYMDIRIPSRARQPVSVRYLPAAAAHDRAYDVLEVQPDSGRIVQLMRYAQLPAGRQLLVSLYALHTGSFFGLPGRVAWMLASLCMSLFLVTGWLLYLNRRANKRALRQLRGSLPAAIAGDGEPWLLAYASQSGLAERLAWQAAAVLQAAGLPVQVRGLAQLDAATLRAARRMLWVVSTFGDGEAPDAARGFDKRVLSQTLPLGELRYALLALGDRQYANFCGFSRRLQQWLAACGAQPLFATLEVDNADAQTLQQWQQQLAELSGGLPVAIDLAQPAWQRWRLRGRALLNPGSMGAPVWRIDLHPPSGSSWKAGDVLVVQPRQSAAVVSACLAQWQLDPQAVVSVDRQQLSLAAAASRRILPPAPSATQALCPAQSWLDALAPLGNREYSIASVPQEGVLQLVVRLANAANGQPGLGSGWLAVHAAEGMEIQAWVRANPGFHRVSAAPMVLIGNGTGIAGLRSLLAEARHAGEFGHWLLFGERHAAHDQLFAAELASWRGEGLLQRLDLLFSRDQPDKLYVQHRLREAVDELRAWLARGAVIHVCGSLHGMAQAVDAELRQLLGEDELDALAAQGRYRRDVY